jgi:Fe-S cluster assembly iron-binding protein IscA
MSKTWLRRGLIGVAAIALLFIVAFAAAVPYVVRNVLEGTASRELGRKVTVQSVSANPFLLRVTINGLAIAEAAPGTGEFVAIDRLVVAASLHSIFYSAPVLDAIEVSGARVRITRLAEHRFNFSDILERQAAKPKPAAPSEPARFALYNIQLAGGQIDFTDQLLGKTFRIADLAFGVPFLSNLPAHREVKVQPSLSAVVDGTPVALRGESRPFHETREFALDLKLAGLDLTDYLGYSPVPLNFALVAGRLDTDLRIAFRGPLAARDGQPARAAELVVSGLLGLRDIDLRAPRASPQPLLRFKQLQLRFGELAPLAQRVVLDEVTLEAPETWVGIDSDGQLNWLRFAQSAVGRTDGAGGADAARAAASPTKATPAQPWQVTVKRATLGNGTVHVSDERIGRFKQDLQNIQLTAQDISTVQNAPPGKLDLKVGLVPQGTAGLNGTLALAPLRGELDYAADDVQLRIAARYLASVIDGTLEGSTAVRGRLVIAQVDNALQLALRDLNVEGKQIALRGPTDSGAQLNIARVAVQGGELDLTARKFSAASLTIDTPRVGVKRLAGGEIGWQRLFKPGTPAPAAQTPAAEKDKADWDVTLAAVELINGTVNWDDVSVEPAAKMTLSALAGTVRNVTAAGTTPMQVSLKGRSSGAAPNALRGSLAVDGTARIKPLQTDLRIDLRNLDLAPARSYVTDHLNAVFVRGEVTSRSRLQLAAQPAGGMRVKLDGGLRVANLQALNPDGNAELLRWQALDVDRINLTLGEGPANVQLGKIALADFFARVIVSAEGRLNLVDVVRRDRAAPEDGATDSGKASVPSTQARALPAQAAAAAGEGTAPRPRIRIEAVQLTRGNVNFTDNFIRPNYTANLTDITGSITTLASDAAEPATLTLTGSVDREAPVTIEGRLNPLAPKLFLDIKGSTKGVDLPRFTPYSAKYAGYPIVKGKLSMDVSYKVENDKLAANNHLFLDQLTFGERVDSPTATKLPVLLAVSLLKNTRGEIDINLPISGSLDDPKFSVGGIIVQVIVNVLTKIVTSPFTLLAAAFGSDAELGYVDFAPGSAQLGKAQQQRLDTLGKALNDRPALRMDIIGRSTSAADVEGVKRAQLDARLRAAKVRAQIRAGGASVAPESVTLEPAERNALLAAVYADDKVVKKPRNAIGLARTLPAPEMEQLLLESIAITASELRALANARAAAVRDHLEQQGKVARDRLFLVEPKIDGADDAKPADGKAPRPPTRVDFVLK